MLVKIWFFTLSFLICLSALGQEPVHVQSPRYSTRIISATTNNQYNIEIGTVSEVSVEDQKLIIEYKEYPKTVRRGDRLFITTGSGSTCIVTVTDISNTIATASVESCPNLEFVAAGDQAKKSRLTRTVKKPSSGSKFKEQGIAALLSYSFTTTASLTGTAGGLSATENDNLGGAFGLNAEYYMFREQGIGFTAGLTYEFARTDIGGTATVGSITITESFSNPSQYTGIIPNASINYMFNQYIYALGGFNYSFISATNTQGASYSGQLGYQLGVGSMFDTHWGAEIQYRWLNFTGTGVPNIDINGITFNGFLLRAGYYF